MSSFSRFQDINKKRGIANQQTNSGFILKGYPSIVLTSGENEVQASVVNKQEKDMAYIYTNLNTPLEVGSVWGAKSLHWLISEEIIVIKDVNWHKYVALLCNMEFNGNWGYFLGPEKSYVNVALKKDVELVSQQKPILVMPSKCGLTINDKVMIKNRAWLIQEEDSISTEGISYFSLRSSTISKDVVEKNPDQPTYIEKEDPIKPQIPASREGVILPLESVELSTEQGFFVSDEPLIIMEAHTETAVQFMVPFGVSELTVTVKENGVETPHHYIVKEM